MSLWAKYYYHSSAANGKNRQPPSAGYVEARGKLVGQLQAWAILRTVEAAALGARGRGGWSQDPLRGGHQQYEMSCKMKKRKELTTRLLGKVHF